MINRLIRDVGGWFSMAQTIQKEVELLRQNYVDWKGHDLLQKYHDVLMDVLKSKQKASIALSPDLAKEYVAIQQEILRRLDT